MGGEPGRSLAVVGRARKAAQPENGSADLLLAWYDRHARRLPWRALPGEPADPYGVWLSEVMLQQTTVTAVAPYFARFLERWPTIEALARAPLQEVLRAWAGLGYYARARNLHACAHRVLVEHGGRFPDDERALRTLPGIGDYTAAAIAAIAFGKPTTPVDGNVERVIARIYAIETPLPQQAKPIIRERARALTPQQRPGDYAQALMDLGATICTPRKPACALCPWRALCLAFRRGDPETLPRRAPKADRPIRRGAVFWVARADGAVLLRNRPPRGLLGGMTEVPGSAWDARFDVSLALAEAPELRIGDGRRVIWTALPGVVTHTFTHFPLELTVFATRVPADTPAPKGMRFVDDDQLATEALPTLMRKVVAHARAQLAEAPLGDR